MIFAYEFAPFYNIARSGRSIDALAFRGRGSHGRRFFVSAPDEVLPLLPQNTRLDMLDYFSSGMSTFSPNATRGNARIVLNEPSKLQAVLSRDSNIQIALVATEKIHYSL